MERHPADRSDQIGWKSKIWRYVDLPKLVSMLSRKQLYFSRLDKLDDHREAMLSPKVVDEQAAALIAEATESGLIREGLDADDIARLTTASNEALLRASTFVNCWHQNEIESMAMWKVYAGQGIAIQSTLRRLRDAIPESAYLAWVGYVDYGQHWMNPELPYLFKDQIYGYENEIRAFMVQFPESYSILEVSDNQPPGIYVDVKLHRLIKKVHLSPGSGSWFRDVVSEVLNVYGLGTKPVVASVADQVPEYRRRYEAAKKEIIRQRIPLEPFLTEDS